MHKLRINPLALEDLMDLKRYISEELQNPESATQVVSKIIESYEKLKEFPTLGGDLASKVDAPTDYRFLVTGNYIVFYKVDDTYVSIYRVLYAKRGYLKIILDDEVV